MKKVRFSLIILVLFVSGAGFVLAKEQAKSKTKPKTRAMTPAVVQAFWKALPLVNSADLAKMGKWKAKTLRYVPAKNLYRCTYKDIKTVVDDAVANGMSALEFFTESTWLGTKAFYISRADLARAAKRFRLRGIFILRTKDTDGNLLQMNWLVLGASHLIVSYKRSANVYVADYNFWTGNYEYKKFHHVSLGVDKKGRRGMFKIKGTNSTRGTLEYLDGPMNSAVKSFTIINARQLRCDYTKFFVDSSKVVSLFPIEIIKPKKGAASKKRSKTELAGD